jgi:hypothetical protein
MLCLLWSRASGILALFIIDLLSPHTISDGTVFYPVEFRRSDVTVFYPVEFRDPMVVYFIK